jgi:hypothetical protein
VNETDLARKYSEQHERKEYNGIKPRPGKSEEIFTTALNHSVGKDLLSML